MLCPDHGIEMDYTINGKCPLCEMLTEPAQERMRNYMENHGPRRLEPGEIANEDNYRE